MVAPHAGGFVPHEEPRISIAGDGVLVAVLEASRVTLLELPNGAAFAEIGVDPEALASEVAWVGAPARLIVLSRYAAHSTVHLLDPAGPRSIAEIRLESPMRLLASAGSSALVVGALGAAILTATDTHLMTYPFPARAVPLAAGGAAGQLIVALATSIEEWDPQSRMPKRRLRLPRAAAITAVGGSERVVWMSTQQEPGRIDVIPLVNRGQPKAHDLPEPVMRLTSHPRSDLVVCIGAESGRLYIVDVDGRARLRVLTPDGFDRVDSAGLLVGRTPGVLVAQAGRPLGFVPLDGRDQSDPALLIPVLPRSEPGLRVPVVELASPAAAGAADATEAESGEHLLHDADDPPGRALGSTAHDPPELMDPDPTEPGELEAAAEPAESSLFGPEPADSEAITRPASSLFDPPASPPSAVRGPAAARAPITQRFPPSVTPPAAPVARPVAPAAPVAALFRAPAAGLPSRGAAPATARPAASASERFSAWRDQVRQNGPRPEPTAAGAPATGSLPPVRTDPRQSWRDEVVAWTRAVIAGAIEHNAPAAPPIDAVVARFELALQLTPALVLLYGAHLCGERGAAPVDVSRVLDRQWDEALGRGELARTQIASYVQSRVALAPIILRVLDELPPLTGSLVGEPGHVALLGPCLVVARDEPLPLLAERCLPRIGGAILAAHGDPILDQLQFEARAYGAAPMVRPSDGLDAAPTEPVIFVVDDPALADRFALPRLA